VVRAPIRTPAASGRSGAPDRSLPKLFKGKAQTVSKAENGHEKHEETQKDDMYTFGDFFGPFRGFLCLLWLFRECCYQFE